MQRGPIERQKLAPLGFDVRAQRIVRAERNVGGEVEDTGQHPVELAAPYPRRVFDDRAVIGHRWSIAGAAHRGHRTRKKGGGGNKPSAALPNQSTTVFYREPAVTFAITSLRLNEPGLNLGGNSLKLWSQRPTIAPAGASRKARCMRQWS